MIELFEKKKSYVKITEKMISLREVKSNEELNYSVIGNKIDYLGDISELNNKEAVFNYMNGLLGNKINSFNMFNIKGDYYFVKYLSYDKELNIYNEVDRDSADYELVIGVTTF